jgi:hypothetical protein
MIAWRESENGKKNRKHLHRDRLQTDGNASSKHTDDVRSTVLTTNRADRESDPEPKNTNQHNADQIARLRKSSKAQAGDRPITISKRLASS